MKPRILCVSSEISFFKEMEGFLAPKGYEVLRAKTTGEAVQQLERENIDVAVLDARIDNLEGCELCRIIKTDENHMDVPVILATNLKSKDDRIRGIEAGVDDFIHHPVNGEEALERIKALISLQPSGTRLGELLVGMNFIGRKELEEALRISKERNIQVGEALVAMGAIDRDHIYWALSNQLKMNYIELSYDMIDLKFIQGYSLGKLEELQALPLYETSGEIHFVISDPMNQAALRELRQMNPGKRVRLHLGLPEKIGKIIRLIKQEASPEAPPAGPAQAPGARAGKEKPGDAPWQAFTQAISASGRGPSFCLYREVNECRLMSPSGGDYETLRQFSGADFNLIRRGIEDRVKRLGAAPGNLYVENANGNPALFQVSEIGGPQKDLLFLRRIPPFLPDDCAAAEFRRLAEELQRSFDREGFLLAGGTDNLRVKQACYLLARTSGWLERFPPAVFIEQRLDLWFPKTIQ
ncbi:MAG TPA: response regulator, partial [Thermodesulfobacteriota bacterium]|nr:response regulator [Thermodesulfobacteriota bacterium]